MVCEEVAEEGADEQEVFLGGRKSEWKLKRKTEETFSAIRYQIKQKLVNDFFWEIQF